MSWFLVERHLSGLTHAGLSALQRALGEATLRLSTPSAPVRYVGSVYLPRQDTCLCLFEAADRTEQEVFPGEHSFWGRRGLPFIARHLNG